LAKRLREGLADISGLTLHDLGSHKSAIVSFTLSGADSTAIRRWLEQKGINVSVSPPSSTPIDANTRKLPPAVRASPHYFNTEEEVDNLVLHLSEYAGAAL